MSKIAQIGPQNSTILKIAGDSHFEPDDVPTFVIDEEYIKKIKDQKDINYLDIENSHNSKEIKDVHTVIGVIPKLKENILDIYPLSVKELVQTVKAKLPNAKQNKIWEIIKKNKMKENTECSVYNFRNKKQEGQYKKSGKLPNGVPSIYNEKLWNLL